MSDQHDRSRNGLDHRRDVRGIVLHTSQRICHGHHGVTLCDQAAEHAIPAGRFRERAVDQDDRGLRILRAGVGCEDAKKNQCGEKKARDASQDLHVHVVTSSRVVVCASRRFRGRLRGASAVPGNVTGRVEAGPLDDGMSGARRPGR